MELITIGFGGQLASGKDESADYLAKKLSEIYPTEVWKRKAFANAVKEVFENTFGVDRDFVEKWKRVDESPEGFIMSVRQCLITIGDGFRKMKPCVWLEKPFIDQEQWNSSYNQILSDLRYRNEAVEICWKRNGVTALIWRPGFENSIMNGSEQELMPFVNYLRDIKLPTGPIAPELVVPESYWHNIGMELVIPDDRHIPFNIWIINDGTKEELFGMIDKWVIPYIENKYYYIPA